MSAGDILTNIDLGPGASRGTSHRAVAVSPRGHRPQVGPVRPADVLRTSSTTADSEYRRALTRSLSDRSPRRTKIADAAGDDAARRPPGPTTTSHDRSHEQRSAAASTSSTGRASSAVTARRQSSDPDRAARPEANRSVDLDGDADRRESERNVPAAAEVSTSLVVPAQGQPNAEFFSISDQVLSPPSHVSLLFGAAAEEVDVRQDVGAGISSEEGPPAPPAGLFESLVTSPIPGLADSSSAVTDTIGESVALDAQTTEVELTASSASRDGSGGPDASADGAEDGEVAARLDATRAALVSGGIPGGGTGALAASNASVGTASEARSGSHAGSKHGAAGPVHALAASNVAGATFDGIAQTQTLGVGGDGAQVGPGALQSGDAGQAAQNGGGNRAEAAQTATSGEISSASKGQGGGNPQPFNSAVTQAHPGSAGPQQLGPMAGTLAVSDVDAAEVADRLANSIRLAEKNGGQLRIRLHPPHLGSLHVEVSSRGGALSVALEVQTASAHSTILDNMPLLREALAHHGAAIDRIDVQLVDPAGDDARPDLTDHDGQQQSEQQPHSDAEDQPDPQPDDDESAVTAASSEELDIQV